jgi:hypothetical protein
MQRGENKVAGHGGLKGGNCGLSVANFANQNNVRILPKYRSKGFGKTETGLLVYLHLVDAVDFVFDRILYRDDI